MPARALSWCSLAIHTRLSRSLSLSSFQRTKHISLLAVGTPSSVELRNEADFHVVAAMGLSHVYLPYHNHAPYSQKRRATLPWTAFNRFETCTPLSGDKLDPTKASISTSDMKQAADSQLSGRPAHLGWLLSKRLISVDS